MRKASKGKIRSIDMPIIDRVLGMEGGYVLNFSNQTFAQFFHEELGVVIYDHHWAVQGGSKAKRLRYYLLQADRRTVVDTLNALWEYREATSLTYDYPELDDSVRVAFFRIIERLGGKPPPDEAHSAASRDSQIDQVVASSLANRLLDISELDPQARGYAFEKFLKDMFNAYGLSARASFRLVGEQIDGSFVLGDDTYLLEAKWTSAPAGAVTLRSFNAKVEDFVFGGGQSKVVQTLRTVRRIWAPIFRSFRGLLLSYSGFTPGGLTAFGRGKSVICMSGLDLHDILSSRLDLATVLAMKVRRTAETGQPFVGVPDLDPPSNL